MTIIEDKKQFLYEFVKFLNAQSNFITIPEYLIDEYLIALKKQKKSGGKV